MSGGERSRVLMARALAVGAPLMLADEPTASLDDEYAATIMEMFRSFNQVGVTVLIATHDRSLIEHGQPRVVTLGHGRLAT